MIDLNALFTLLSILLSIVIFNICTQLILCAGQGLPAKISKSESNDLSNDKFVSPASDAEDRKWHQRHTCSEIHEDDGSPNQLRVETQAGREVRASTDGLSNGYLDCKTSKGDKWQNGKLRHAKGNEKLKGDFDGEALEANRTEVDYHRNSSSENGGEKHKISEISPSHDRHRSRSRSTGHTRDRSRSCSIVEEYAHSKRRHSREPGSLYYTSRHKTDYDLDEERVRARGREHRHGSIDLVEDDRRDHCSKYHSLEARDRGRSRDKDVDRELHRERKREETSRNKEVDWERRREKERGRSHERYRRDVEEDRSKEREEGRDRRREKERGQNRDTVNERDRRREKERDRSRDRTRGGERDRGRESEWDHRNRERDTMKERERRDDRYRHKDKDAANGKDKHLRHDDGNDGGDRHRKHSRHEENEYHADRKRNYDHSVEVYNSKRSTMEEDERKLKRYFI